MRFCLNLFPEILQSIALLTNRTPKKTYKDNLCLFKALTLHLHGNERLEEETSKIFNLFLVNSPNHGPSKIQGNCMDDIPSVEDIVGINIFIYNIDLIQTRQCIKDQHDKASK